MHTVRITLAAIGVAAALIAGTLASPASASPHVDAAPTAPLQARDGYVYVYQHINFGGAWCRWYGDDADYRYNSNGCGNWDNQVSSAWNNGYYNSYPDVMFFQYVNYKGVSVCLRNGVAWSNMPSGWNDRPSSHKWVNC